MSTQDLLPLIPSNRWTSHPILRRILILYCLYLLFSYVSSGSNNTSARGETSFLLPTKAEPYSNQNDAQISREATIRDMLADEPSVWPATDLQALQQSYDNTLLPVTAVLIHWRRRRSLDLLVEALAMHPFVREIIVWNNNPGVHLDKATFTLSSSNAPTIRIVNSPSFMGDQAIFSACSLAIYSTCYYNHENVYNPSLDVLYLKYLDVDAKRRGIIESIEEEAYWYMKHLQFENLLDLDLHAAATPFRSAFFPRDFASRFLSQQSATLDLLPRNALANSSLYFSIYTNAYSQSLIHSLLPLNIEGEVEAAFPPLNADQQHIILDALTKLYDTLHLQDPTLIPDPFPVDTAHVGHDMRTPCSKNQCIFLSTFTPFPAASSFRIKYDTVPSPQTRSAWPFAIGQHPQKPITPFKPMAASQFDPRRITSLDSYASAIDNLKTSFNQSVFPRYDDWSERNVYSLAVDGKRSTCMLTRWSAVVGSYFGLEFLVEIADIQFVTLIGSEDLANIISLDEEDVTGDSWEVWTLRKGSKEWNRRRLVAPAAASRIDSELPRLTQVQFELTPLEDVDAATTSIKRIKFVSRDIKAKRLALCQMQFDDLVV